MSVMWSPLESKDGPGRHSGKDGDDNRSTSTDTSLPTDDKQQMRPQQMTNKTETFFRCSRFLLCKRVVCTSHTLESGVSPSTHSCSAAQLMAEQVMVLDSDSVGSEESFTMLNVPAESAVTPQEQQFLLEQLQHLSSSGITGQEARRRSFQCFQTNSRRSR